jgi:hypothetical protein
MRRIKPEFLAKNPLVGRRSWNLMTVHISSSRSPFAGIWRGSIPSRSECAPRRRFGGQRERIAKLPEPLLRFFFGRAS